MATKPKEAISYPRQTTEIRIVTTLGKPTPRTFKDAHEARGVYDRESMAQRGWKIVRTTCIHEDITP